MMSKLHIKNKYGIAPNELLNRPDVSLKAEGLFTYIQSKPNGWKFSIERISNQHSDGKASIRAALKELEGLGYLKRVPARDEKGFAGYDYYLYENLSSENQTTDNQSSENYVTFSNKDNSNKDNSNKDIESSKLAVCGDEINQLMDFFYQLNPGLNYGNKTQRNAITFLIDKFGLDNARRVVKYACQVQGERYAPVITTPLQLKNKLGDLNIYQQKEKQGGDTAIINLNE